MKIQIPSEVNRILDILYSNGYEGYIVGGCVRDSILGNIPNDWDICTNAKPKDMLNIFKEFKVIPTGLKHGTVTVVENNEHFEITTYRIDKEYVDGRRPKEVEFTNNLKEDLKRRDFTINAMAYNSVEGLIDYYDGMMDISNKKIRCVGNPIDRFNEDYLRMLRAVRFAAQLNYILDIETFNAIKKLSKNIVNISKERIRDEINKILLSESPANGIRLLEVTGLLKYIIPELQQCVKFEQRNPYHDKDVFEHIMSVLDNTEKDLILRLSALFHDIAKPHCFTIDEDDVGHFYYHHMKGMDITANILKRLKYDNKTIDAVKKLVKEHMLKHEQFTPKAMKRLISRLGSENIYRLFELQIADIKGSKSPDDFSNIIKAKDLCDKILNEKQPLTTRDLDINGFELMEFGIEKGKEIGVILEKLLDMVLENPDLNEKNLLLEEVKKLHKKGI